MNSYLFMKRTFVLLVLLTFCVLLSIATTETMYFPGSVQILPSQNSVIGTPFVVQYSAHLGFAADQANVMIQLSPGIKLISGDLTWKGNPSNTIYVDREIVLQISKDGWHSIRGVITAVNPIPANIISRWGRFRTQYCYASNGVLCWDHDSTELVKKIADSLIFSTKDIQRRAKKRADSLHALTSIDNQLMVMYWGSHSEALLDYNAASNGTKVNGFAIDHRLITAPLKPNCDSLVLIDTLVGRVCHLLPPARKFVVAQIGLSQVRELRNFDQTILSTPFSFTNWPHISPQEQLLSERRLLIQRQEAIMDSLIYR